MSIKVSIIIPVFNTEKYLECCLKSVLDQTLSDIEVICVDDGSRDNSLKILQRIRKNDKRVVILKQKQSGAATARNSAIKVAKGEFICFMDSDDFYPDKNILSTLYTTAKKHNVYICGGELDYFDKSGLAHDNSDYQFLEEGLIEYRTYQKDYGFTRFIYNREFLQKNQIFFPKSVYYEDPVFLATAMNAAKKFYALKKIVYSYRVSHKKPHWTKNKILDLLKGFESNFALSKNNNLDDLHKTTYQRLTMDFFFKEICVFLKDKNVIDQFLKTLFTVDWGKIDSAPYSLYEQLKKKRTFFQKKLFKSNFILIKKFLINIQKVSDFAKEVLNTPSCDIRPLPKHAPKVSVIIPVYNVEKFLDRCLQSVVNQSFKNLEIICVNDGSTDGSETIIKKYVKKDHRIKLITQKNGGLSAARNTGLKAATAEYIMFVDSDDWIEKHTVMIALDKMLSNPQIDIVNFGANVVFDNNPYSIINLNEGILNYHKIKYNGEYTLQTDLVIDTTVTAWNKLYKKSIIDKFSIFFPEGLLYEDNAFFYKYVLHASKIYFVPAYLYNYFQRSDSIMGSMFSKKSSRVIDRLKIFNIVYNYYKDNNALSSNKELISTFFNGCLWNDYTYAIRRNKPKVLKYATKIAKDYNPLYFDTGVIKNLIKKKYHKLQIIKHLSLKQLVFSKEKENENTTFRFLGLKIKMPKKSMKFKDFVKQEFNYIWPQLNELTKKQSEIAAQNESLIADLFEKSKKQEEAITQNEQLITNLCEKMKKQEEILLENSNLITELGKKDEQQTEKLTKNALLVTSLREMLQKQDGMLTKTTSLTTDLSEQIKKQRETTNQCESLIIKLREKIQKQDNILSQNRQTITNLHEISNKHAELIAENSHLIADCCEKDTVKGEEIIRNSNLINELLKEGKEQSETIVQSKNSIKDLYEQAQKQEEAFKEELFYLYSKYVVKNSSVTRLNPTELKGTSICSVSQWENMRYLFPHLKFETSLNDRNKLDYYFAWGTKYYRENLQVFKDAIFYDRPLFVAEDGFLRSIDTWANQKASLSERMGISFVFDSVVPYYDARYVSFLESMLNDKNLIIKEKEKERARKCINKILDTHLTKYNHQPIFTPSIGRKGVKKVLVVDQSYGDMSIYKGLATNSTFDTMLQTAIKENPNADIIVKIHPDTIAGAGGYYSNLKEENNIFIQKDPINPISLLKYVDKVYVCTSQLGFEALMCGKEVCVFGMPFYAGWGLTKDHQTLERRNNKRSLEELFFITYIMYSFYVNPIKKASCEIEEAMDYLLNVRRDYFEKNNIKCNIKL